MHSCGWIGLSIGVSTHNGLTIGKPAHPKRSNPMQQLFTLLAVLFGLLTHTSLYAADKPPNILASVARMKPPCGAIRGRAPRNPDYARRASSGLLATCPRLRQAVKASFDAPCVTSEHSMVQNVSDGVTNPSRFVGKLIFSLPTICTKSS